MIKKVIKSNFYQIKVNSHLDCCWSEWFSGLKIIHKKDGTSILSGLLADQSALHAVLNKIRDMNLDLLSVERVESNITGKTKNKKLSSALDSKKVLNQKSSREESGGGVKLLNKNKNKNQLLQEE